MSKLIVRSLVTWFNDGKRLTALVLAMTQMAFPWLRTKGVPIPEGSELSFGTWLATIVLLILSKVDVRIPTEPK